MIYFVQGERLQLAADEAGLTPRDYVLTRVLSELPPTILRPAIPGG